MIRVFAMGLLSAALALASSGCCCVSRPVAGAPACDPVGYGSAVPSGEQYCGLGQCCAPDDYFCQGPLGYLRYMFTCGSGCGDYYVDEWISDPPACCDPCDMDGNWTGAEYCGPSIFGCLSRLWGHRYEAGGCEPLCGGGCSAGCGAAGAGSYSPYADLPVPEEGVIVERGPWVEGGRSPQDAGQAEPMPAPSEAPPTREISTQAPRKLKHMPHRRTMPSARSTR